MGSRIGLLVPAANIVAEENFHRMTPAAITVCTTRLEHAKWRASDAVGISEQEIVAGHVDLWDDMEAAASELVKTEPDVLAFACTSGSFVKGAAWEHTLRERIGRALGVPMVTAAPAAVASLANLGARKVVAVTEYSSAMNDLFKRFFESNGIEVLDIVGTEDLERLGADYSLDAWTVTTPAPAEVAFQMALGVLKAEADAIFISGTGFGVIEMIELLEARTGKPVATSNQATLWACLQALGYRQPIPHYGRLLRAAA